MKRQNTKVVSIGYVKIGGQNPVAVQSMTKTFTRNVQATVRQIKRLEDAGCQIVRCAVPEEEDARAISQIKKQIRIPLVADIHFDHKLALIAIEAGADKIRINPGNIGGREKLKAVVSAAKEKKIPIRIGVNSGSLEKGVLAKYSHPVAKALVESALRNIHLLEKMDFTDIVVSIKSTSVPVTVEAYRMLSKKVEYPLHIGVTEAGMGIPGIVKSSIGIGSLLLDGIGDTLRVSLTGNPVREVDAAKEILKSLGLIKAVTVISCPTCGRCQVNVGRLVGIIQDRTKGIKKAIKIAIMGCAVNGPGEAADADIGFAGGKGSGLIFRSGRIVKKVRDSEVLKELLKEIGRLT